ncbi:MAG: AIM24 family protein [Candidatus Caenarcaniphilales bacterium]|nr:AIM24 family protein [Candidatus Caenarcaniphilales bacterium]
MNTNSTFIAQQKQIQLTQLGSRGQLVWEAKLGNNRIIVLRYTTSNGSNESFIVEILKDQNTKLLVLPGSASVLKSKSRLTLDHYGLKEKGVSGFIKSQVTGESFVMTEVKGEGTVRLTPNSDCPGIKQFQNTKLFIPNTNVAYVQSLLGDFEIHTAQKVKSDMPIAFSEILLKSALVLFETDNFYEVEIEADHFVDVEANEIVFWTGDLIYDDARDSSNGEGSLVRFSGMGKVYLSLSV